MKGRRHLAARLALPLMLPIAMSAVALASTVGALRGGVLGAPTAAANAGGTGMGVSGVGQVALSAGFRGTGLAIAIAVALAESGGDPRATDYDADGTVDRGLWQINSIHRRFAPSCDYDPDCAARAAYVLSGRGRNWTPWVSFERGTEIPYLPAALAWIGSTRDAGPA